jgi:hypothetical protein
MARGFCEHRSSIRNGDLELRRKAERYDGWRSMNKLYALGTGGPVIPSTHRRRSHDLELILQACSPRPFCVKLYSTSIVHGQLTFRNGIGQHIFTPDVA